MISKIDGLVGGLDDAYFYYRNRLFRKEPALFAGGWGSDAAIEAVIERFQLPGCCQDIDIDWQNSWRASRTFQLRDGVFHTPKFHNYYFGKKLPDTN